MASKVYEEASRHGLAVRSFMTTHNKRTTAKWNDGHSIKPPCGQSPPSPLPTDTTIPTINLSRTHDIESSQQKHPTLTGWLVIDMQSVTSAQSPEKARIIVCQHRIYHLMESSCLHTQLITHLAPHMFAFRQACIMHAVDEYCSKWPNQEVTPLPDIYFFDGWRVRPCMKIPTNLSRE